VKRVEEERGFEYLYSAFLRHKEFVLLLVGVGGLISLILKR